MTSLRKLVIGAPFGNYLDFPCTTPTLGTYTAKYRGGIGKRVWRVLKTVRYYPGIHGWKNKLGLPNPGLANLAYHCAYSDKLRDSIRSKILSVMGHTTDDWGYLVGLARDLCPLAAELNASCPNCPGEDRSDYDKVFQVAAAVPAAPRLIVKLPPVGYRGLVARATDAGINAFHCCNTLPTPGGGLSGKPLQALSLQAVVDVREVLRTRGMENNAIVIGGGGVTHMADAQRFLDAGATSVSVASVLLNPLNWPRIKRLARALAGPAVAISIRAGAII